MKTLVVELHHLGDAVLSMPFVRAALRRGPVSVCCRPAVAPVFRLLEPAPDVLTWDPPWHEESPLKSRAALRHMTDAAEFWRRKGFDAAVCSWADARVQWMMALSGIPLRVGFPMNRGNYLAHETPWRARQLRIGRVLAWIGSVFQQGPLLTHPLQRTDYLQHRLEDWRQLAGVLGFEPDTAHPWFPAPPVGALPREAVHFLARCKKENRRVLAVHPGGRVATKRWPMERFQTLLDGVLRAPEGWGVLVVGAPGEPLPNVQSPHQCAVVTSTIGMLASVAAVSDRVLCHDSLFGHLAAAQGKPVHAIFGSGHPAWFAPGGDASGVIRADVCPFHPCVDRCRQPSILCLEAIDTERVGRALEDALREA